MKNSFFKFSITMFVVISLFALTACGGGGGGGNSSGDNGGGNEGGGNSIITNQTLQTTAISNIIARLKNNFASLFRLSSIRASAFPDDFYDAYNGGKNGDKNTGKALLNIARIEISDNNFDVEKVLDSSLASFKKRFKANEIITENSNMIVAKSDGYNIGFSIQQNGDVKMFTYFATYGTKSEGGELIGVSFIKLKDYVTFPFRLESSGVLQGYVYLGFQLYNGFATPGNDEETLAHIFATDDKEFSYENTKTHESEKIQISEETTSDDTNDATSYLEKFPETVAIRYAIKPIRENAARISSFAPSSSARATINIANSLKDYDTLAKVKALISADTIADFNKNFANAQQLLKDQKVTDSVISNGIINMSVGKDTNTGLTIGLAVESADVALKINGQDYNFIANTKTWFVVDPTSKAIAAFSYCDTKEAQSSGTYIFRINADGSELEGKSFWNENNENLSYFPNVKYDEDNMNRNSTFTGDASQMVYTLYNSQNRTKVEEGCPITIKYDGTLVK